MDNKYFLSQIKRATDGTYTKGVVIHDTKDNALNGFHAYFGAYGYGKDANTDYVACFVSDMSGAIIKSEVDNRIPVDETEEEATNENE
jgi:hypothetical protein